MVRSLALPLLLLLLLVTAPLTTAENSRVGTCAEGDCDHGKGVFEYKNGDVYYGMFAAYMRHGDGLCSYNVSEGAGEEALGAAFRKYDGEWSLDMFDGKGQLELVDGSTYKGYFKEGVLHGDHPARQTYANGSFYEGQFQHGRKHGRGAWMDVDIRGTTYLGDWESNQMHGEGILEMQDGYMYNGTFVHGACTGHAKIRYAVAQGDSISEPAWYDGEMVDGYRHGTGTFRMPYMNGIRGAWWEYSGLWENDEMVGKVVTQNPTGSKNPDDWDVGSLSESGEPENDLPEEEEQVAGEQTRSVEE
jgi:hypothetical protein